MNTFNNARFRGTEKILEESLISIASEKTVSEITVMELCECAEINRSTFYAHYENIKDMGHKLLSSKFAEVNSSFNTQLKKSTGPQLKKELKNNVELLLNTVKDNKKLCLAFLTVNSELDVYDKSYDLILKSLGRGGKPGKTPAEKYKNAIDHFTFYTILTTYIKNGCKDKADFVTDLLTKELGK